MGKVNYIIECTNPLYGTYGIFEQDNSTGIEIYSGTYDECVDYETRNLK